MGGRSSKPKKQRVDWGKVRKTASEVASKTAEVAKGTAEVAVKATKSLASTFSEFLNSPEGKAISANVATTYAKNIKDPQMKEIFENNARNISITYAKLLKDYSGDPNMAKKETASIYKEKGVNQKDIEDYLTQVDKELAEQLPQQKTGGEFESAYHGAADMYAEKYSEIFGGGDNGSSNCKGKFFGGSEIDMEVIREYADTMNSFTKQKIVEDIIDALSNMGFNITGDTFQDKIQSLLKIIPNSKRNGKKFKAEAESQKKICRMLAEVLNKQFGEDIISKDAPAPVVCQTVAELVESMRTGMRMEFMIVHDELKKVLKNLFVLKAQLEKIFKPIMQGINNSSDPKLKTKTAKYTGLHKMLLDEMNRQITMLKELLNVTITPTEVKLEHLIKDTDELQGIIEQLNYKPGTSQFSDTISTVLMNMGVTADYALIIDKALKKVGLTMKEYAQSENLKKVTDHVSNVLMERDMTDEEMYEFLQAVQLLYKNFYRAKDIQKALERTGGFDENMWGGYDYGDQYEGGVQRRIKTSYEDSDFKKSNLDSRLRMKREVRDIIFKTFNKQVDEQMQRIILSLDAMADKLGETIPLSDQLDGFRSSLVKLRPILTRKNAYIALIGYYNDALSKERRETFIAQLKLIKSYLETMLEMSIYQQAAGYLRDIMANIDAMIRTIDTFSDKIAQKYGSSHKKGGGKDDESGDEDTETIEICEFVRETEDEDEESKEKKKKKKDKDDSEGEGNDDDDNDDEGEGTKEGGDTKYYDIPKPYLPKERVIRKIPITLGEVIRKFDYYYQVAQIKENLKYSAKEIDYYGENYVSLRAEAVAKKVDKIKDDYDEKMEEINNDEYLKSGTNDREKRELTEQKQRTIRFVKDYYSALTNFWRTVEAVDEYMRVFTSDLIKNKAQVEDIKSMLDETEVIYDWYDGESGRLIHEVFDSFPAGVTTSGLNDYRNNEKILDFDYKAYAQKQPQQQLAIEDVLKNSGYIMDIHNAPTGDQRIFPIKRIYNTGGEHYYHGIGTLKDGVGGRLIFAKGGIYQVFLEKSNDAAANSTKAKSVNQYDIVADLMPGNPYITIDLDSNEHGLSLIPKMRSIMQHMLVLKNILSVFLSIGSKFGEKELHKKIFMTPTQIYKNLTNYIEICSFGFGFGEGIYTVQIQNTIDFTAGGNNLIIKDNVKSNRTYSNFGVGNSIYVNAGPSNIDYKVNLGNQNDIQKMEYKRKFGVYMRHYGASSLNKLHEEDEMFVMIIKAMCAKILVVTGIYDLMERPDQSMTYSPIRFMIGASDEVPEIIEKATPLYIRLPLLAEFYRELFDFDSLHWDSGDNPPEWKQMSYTSRAEKISMMPEMDGIFSGLIRIIFKKIKHYSVVDYTDVELKEVIKEVNMIYNKYSSSQNPVMDAIRDFVTEINKRYGLLSQRERNLYEREFGHKYQYSEFGDISEKRPVDLPLLPDEEEIDFESSVAPAPSRGFERSSESDIDEFKSKESLNFIQQQHRELLNRFRCKLDEYFKNGISKLRNTNVFPASADAFAKGHKYNVGGRKEIDDKSFKPAIKSAQIQLKNEKEAENRYKIISSLLRGSDIMNKTDYLRYTLFHETVITGLNTLSGIHTALVNYWDVIVRTDIQGYKEEIKKLGDNYDNGNAGPGDFRNLTTPGGPGGGRRRGADFAEYLDAAFKEKLYGEHLSGDNNPIIFEVPERYFDTAITTASPNVSIKDDGNFYEFLKPHEIAHDIIEAVYGISYDLQDLVSMKVSDNKISINFGKIKKYTEDLFSHVRYYLDILRPHIDKKIIERYTNKYKTGSLYWLQEQLIEKLFEGRQPYNTREGTLVDYYPSKTGYINLDELNRILNNTLRFLGEEHEVAGVKTRFGWGQLIAKLIFYDNQLKNSGVFGINYSEYFSGSDSLGGNSPSMGIDFSKPQNKLLMKDTGAKQIVYPDYSNRFHQLYDWPSISWSPNQSLLFAFNQLLAKYINLCYDSTSEKIYINTISNLVNGPANASIMNVEKNSYPDTIRNKDGRGTSVQIVSSAGGEIDVSAQKIYSRVTPSVFTGTMGQGNPPPDPVALAAYGAIVLNEDLNDAGFTNLLNNANQNDFGIGQGGQGTNWNAIFASQGGIVTASIIGANFTDKNTGNPIAPADFKKAIKKNIPQPTALNITGGPNPQRDRRKVLAATTLALIDLTVDEKQIPGFYKKLLKEIIAKPGQYTDNDTVLRKISDGYIASAETVKKFVFASETTVNKDIPFPISAGDKTKNDTTEQFGRRTDPDPNKIIYSSLALILRNLITSKNSSNQVPIFLLDNIAEVSQFTKEALKAHLPTFRNLFKSIINKGEFLKKFMRMNNVYCYRYNYDPAAAAAWSAPNVNDTTIHVPGLSAEGKIQVTTPDGSKKTKVHFNSIITSIISASTSVIACIDNVLRELADEPKYFEISNNFIQEYKSAHGINPLMPISSSLMIMKPMDDNYDLTNHLPFSHNGTNAFKFAYGSRGLLGRPHVEIQAENVPGWTDLVELYNMMALEREQIDKSKSINYIKTVGRLIRYINEIRHYKANLSTKLLAAYNEHIHKKGGTPNANRVVTHEVTHISIPRIRFIRETSTYGGYNVEVKTNRSYISIIENFNDNSNPNTNNSPVFALKKNNSMPDVIELTESSFKDDSLEKLAKTTAGNVSKESDSLAVLNVLDINIVPINLHALMRDIPLAPLYNYSYTFDRLIIELYYGLNNDYGNLLLASLCHNKGDKSKLHGFTARSAGINLETPIASDKTVLRGEKELFVALLIDPYREVNRPSEYVILGHMFKGNINTPLGRPKFLSDEIFNKAMFGSIYTDPDKYDLVYLNKGPIMNDSIMDRAVENFNLTYMNIIKGRESNMERIPHESALSSYTIASEVAMQLKFIGMLRFNTVFIRNLVFMVNAYRSLRFKLRKDLMYNKGIVVNSNAVTRHDNTELILNQTREESPEYDTLYGYGDFA